MLLSPSKDALLQYYEQYGGNILSVWPIGWRPIHHEDDLVKGAVKKGEYIFINGLHAKETLYELPPLGRDRLEILVETSVAGVPLTFCARKYGVSSHELAETVPQATKHPWYVFGKLAEPGVVRVKRWGPAYRSMP